MLWRILLYGLLLAAWATAADAQTWPRGADGTPAPCAYLDANNNPTVCSASSPLPITSSAPTSSTTDLYGFGRNWFNSPSVLSDGTNMFGGWPFWLDDRSAVIYAGGNTAAFAYKTQDAGKSWARVATTFPTFGGNTTPCGARAANGNLIICGRALNNEQLFLTTNGTVFTAVNPTVVAATQWGSMNTQGSTVLAVSNATGHNVRFARSTDNGVSFTGSEPATPGVAMTVGPNGLVSPSASVWLFIGHAAASTTHRIYRSTDDGLTWTQVHSVTAAAQPGTSIGCLSSTICVATVDENGATERSTILRSTDAGATWTEIVDTLQHTNGTPALGSAIAVFDANVAVVVTSSNGISNAYFRTIDAGLTWTPVVGPTINCGGVCDFRSAVTVRSGKAILLNTVGVTGNLRPIYSTALTQGSTVVTGAEGNPASIDESGATLVRQAPVSTDTTLTAGAPWTVAPSQRSTLFNSQTTGAANTAVVTTIAASASVRTHVYRVSARCSAGTSSITITDGGSTIFSTAATEVGTTTFTTQWNPGLTGATNSAVVITLATCGVGNTGTLHVQADRY